MFMKTQKENSANIQPSWPRAWSIIYTYNYIIIVSLISASPLLQLYYTDNLIQSKQKDYYHDCYHNLSNKIIRYLGLSFHFSDVEEISGVLFR